MAGPIVGGLSSSTRLMMITTTSAAALAAGSALSGVESSHKAGALALMTLFAGLFMIGAAVARLGRYTRFVSHSVMTGFLTGVSVNIILGQIPDLTGVPSHGSINLEKALYVVLHPGQIDVASLLTGLAAMVIIVGLRPTRLSTIGALIALVVPTIGVILAEADSVARVRDSGAIPAGVPLPALPTIGDFSVNLLIGAASVAAIVLVQGAGVAQAAPNPGGTMSDANRDFLAQGLGNLASGLVKGQPVGGSVGQTALNVSLNARSRWASVSSGIWMLVILLAFSQVIGAVAMPTLAALLIVAGVASLRVGQVTTIFRTGATSEIAIVTTFVATLLLPVAAAVGIGVALSLLLQVNRDALDLRVVQLVPSPEGWHEVGAPKALASRSVTLLDVYGSLLYAGSRTLQARLPDPTGSERAAVVIRLRGRTQLGSTFFLVIDDYADRLATAGGRLFLSGLDPKLLAQFARAGGPRAERIMAFAATDVIGESSAQAYARAAKWAAAGDEKPPS
jgi:SulP family sulfate permease